MRIKRILKKDNLFNLRLLYIKTKDEKYFNLILKRFNFFILKYTRKYSNNMFDREDLSQYAKVGLWRGLLKEAKMESHLVRNITFSVKTEVNNNFRKMRRFDKENTSTEKLEHLIYRDSNIVDKIDDSHIHNKLSKKLTSYQLQIFRLMKIGYRQIDIARETGLHVNCVSDAFLRIKRKYRELSTMI